MKFLLLMFHLCLLVGCSVVRYDSWAWLEEPSHQKWREIVITGYGREIRFSIPDRVRQMDHQAQIWPDIENSGDSIQVNAEPLNLLEPYVRITQVNWDGYWGGFTEESNHDFYVDVGVFFHESNSNLTRMTVDDRISEREDHWSSVYGNPESAVARYFFGNYWVKSFENQNGLVFVAENQPQVTADHQNYYIPIGDRHELQFTFFVRDKRWGREEDPDWNKSRWDLVTKIMNSVTITPNPQGSDLD